MRGWWAVWVAVAAAAVGVWLLTDDRRVRYSDENGNVYAPLLFSQEQVISYGHIVSLGPSCIGAYYLKRYNRRPDGRLPWDWTLFTSPDTALTVISDILARNFSGYLDDTASESHDVDSAASESSDADDITASDRSDADVVAASHRSDADDGAASDRSDANGKVWITHNRYPIIWMHEKPGVDAASRAAVVTLQRILRQPRGTLVFLHTWLPACSEDGAVARYGDQLATGVGDLAAVMRSTLYKHVAYQLVIAVVSTPAEDCSCGAQVRAVGRRIEAAHPAAVLRYLPVSDRVGDGTPEWDTWGDPLPWHTLMTNFVAEQQPRSQLN